MARGLSSFSSIETRVWEVSLYGVQLTDTSPGKLASLADIGLQDNADALDFSFSSTPRLSAIKEEYSQLDDTDHRQSSVIWNHDQSLIDVDTHSTGFVDDEVSIGRGLECTATKAQEVQAQRKRTYRDMALSEEAVAACPEKLNDAVMSKARERFEAAKLAAAERRRQRDEGIQKRTKELDEADRRQQALQTALDQRYEQLCVELEVSLAMALSHVSIEFWIKTF